MYYVRFWLTTPCEDSVCFILNSCTAIIRGRRVARYSVARFPASPLRLIRGYRSSAAGPSLQCGSGENTQDEGIFACRQTRTALPCLQHRIDKQRSVDETRLKGDARRANHWADKEVLTEGKEVGPGCTRFPLAVRSADISEGNIRHSLSEGSTLSDVLLLADSDKYCYQRDQSDGKKLRSEPSGFTMEATSRIGSIGQAK